MKRDGTVVEISPRELVPGDILLIDAGNTVPADGRLLDCANLRIQEGLLTGSSDPAEKKAQPLLQPAARIADRQNSIFSGTVVTTGHGTAVITATGMQTELGQIANARQAAVQGPTSFQQILGQQAVRGLIIAGLLAMAVVFGLGLLRGEALGLLFMTAVSLAVALVPVGLPAVVTIAMAVGVQRLRRNSALIRKQSVVDTLASITVIASDKTGLFTENNMTVTALESVDAQVDLQEDLHSFSRTVNPDFKPLPVLSQTTSLQLLLIGGALCNDASLKPSLLLSSEFRVIGNPTECALIIAANLGGMWKPKLEEALPRVAERPFDSRRKRMTTVHAWANIDTLDIINKIKAENQTANFIAFTKGSVEGLLDISSHVWANHHPVPLDDDSRKRIDDAHNRLTGSGLRVMGVAFQLRNNERADDINEPLEKNLVFIGLVGMTDPLRPEAKKAVRMVQTAGIRPIMITGDHPLTAAFFARELGMIKREAAGGIITGLDLEKCSVEELEKTVDKVTVYARVSPDHKLKIVQALQNKGHIVAMTGNGVNDALALKIADIGVAMGITGTDESKETADLVLRDDNFASIVAAVHESRRIYDHIHNLIKYALISNSGEIWVILAASLMGMPLPLSLLQILWMNLVTAGLPGLALNFELAEIDALHRPPYHLKGSIFSSGRGRDIFWTGLVLAASSLGSGYWAWSSGNPAWQTMIFTTFALSQVGIALTQRSNPNLLFKLGLFTNKFLLGSLILSIALQLAVIYVPFLQVIFKTIPLSINDLLISMGVSTAVFLTIEVFGWLLRLRGKK